MVLATVRVSWLFEKPAKGQLPNCFGDGGKANLPSAKWSYLCKRSSCDISISLIFRRNGGH